MDSSRPTLSYNAAGPTTAVRSPNSQSVTFTYTAAGQRRSMDATNSGRSTYTYDPANQLNYGQVIAGRTTYTYDLTGHQRIEQPPAGNRTTTTWNYENQPTQYRLPSGSPVTMAYNGDNRRISLVQGTSTTKFMWDPVIDAYIQELNGSNVLIASYTNEPQQYGGVLSQRRGSTSRFLHADALGTTRLLTSTAGATTDTCLFDAWGNPVSSTGSTVSPFRWVGRYGYYTDSTTGLIYVRARMYQPTTGRWSSIDPLRFAASMNWYMYATLAPVRSLDASGLLTSESTPVVFRKCGVFDWNAKWVLGETEQNGVILQKVCVKRSITLCIEGAKCEWNSPPSTIKCNNGRKCDAMDDRFPIEDHFCYWEAWRIIGGKYVFVPGGLRVDPSPAQLNEGKVPTDTFAFLGCKDSETKSCTKGSLEQTGKAYFVPKVVISGTLHNLLVQFEQGSRGVSYACSLYSMCADDRKNQKHLVQLEMDSRAYGESVVNLGPHWEKSIRVSWSCCKGCPSDGCDGVSTREEQLIDRAISP